MANVGFWGTNAFGASVGIKERWGSAIGAVSGTGAAVGWRALVGADKKAYGELVGLGVGVIASTALLIPRKTRGAGWASLFAAVGSQGILALERALTTGFGAMAGVEINRVPQLGMASMDRVPQLKDAANAHSLNNPAAAQVAGVVPGVNPLAKAFGSTLWG